MKIYWGSKDIPELAGLPVSVRNKNYKEAYFLAQSHPQYWLGVVLAFALMMVISLSFNRVISQDDTFLLSIIRAGCALLPAVFVAGQFRIAVMRKHYPHILSRCDVQPGESERLIQEADNREHHQWRYLRWFCRPWLLLTLLILLYCMSKIAA